MERDVKDKQLKLEHNSYTSRSKTSAAPISLFKADSERACSSSLGCGCGSLTPFLRLLTGITEASSESSWDNEQQN